MKKLEANAFDELHVKTPKHDAKNGITNLQNYLEIQRQNIENLLRRGTQYYHP